ncbi:MAG: EAL and HDOD domain-containing protein [Myxococcota bacterium]
MSQGVFVGRQPIVDRDQQVVAYELLFRGSKDASFANFKDASDAAMRVIVNTFASLGMDAVLGRAQGFFNVNREVLLSEMIEVLPKERVVIEILEDVVPDAEVIARCKALQEAGYEIALDDWVVDDPREVLLPFANVVKVDLPAVDRGDLRRLVRGLRRRPLQLLAEKVETAEEFEICLGHGFDWFQGYFFAKPVVLEGVDIEASKTTLISLLKMVTGEADTDQIVNAFKQDGKLGLSLLRLVNTAGQAVRVRLQTIEDAVRHLGRQRLSRWVTLLLFVEGRDGDVGRDPLLIAAGRRARFMELVVEKTFQGPMRDELQEEAFLVGMLSLADALLGCPIDDLVRELRLGADVSLALTHHEGELGALLALAVATERGEIDKMETILSARDLDLAALQEIENQAYVWVNGLTKPVS